MKGKSIMILPILNVKDVDASAAFYKDKLGFNDLYGRR
jgi:catechol 2,3-dioxygenase-like lactoylglutathione lyase family enzyme